MKYIFKLFRGIWYLTWYLFAATIVLIAAVFGLIRLLLPLVGDYNKDIESFATEYIGRPIKIMSLDAEWHGFSPSLVLNNVRLLSSDGKETLLHLARARLDFDVLAIAETKQIQFQRFALSGANLSLVRQENGQISLSGFESSKIEAPSEEDQGQVIQWLMSQGEISLHAKNLIFTDQVGNKKRFYFSDVSFDLRNRGNRHLIEGSIGFAEQKQQEFAFAMDIVGDITAGSDWSGAMYFSGMNLDVNDIFGELAMMGHRFYIGKSNFNLWSNWKNGSLSGMQGDVSLKNVTSHSTKSSTPLLSAILQANNGQPKNNDFPVTGVSSSVNYQSIIGRFIWDKYDEGWQLLSDEFVISHNRRVWPTSQIAIHYYKDQQASRRLKLRASLIRIEDIAPLVPLFVGNYKDYYSLLNQFSAKGDIENINFNWAEKDNQYNLAARVKQLDFSKVKKLPAIKGLSGELRVKNHNGSFAFNTGRSELFMPAVFRGEIPVKKLVGDIGWVVDENGVSFSSRNLELDTAHFQAKAVLDLEIPYSNKSPFISVISKFKNADASKASLYYPVSIMSERALRWLDTAIVQGDVISGGAIVYGPIREFPFTRGQGVFDVQFEVDNAILDYAEDWPKLHSAHANVTFKGSALNIKVDRAKIFDSNIVESKVILPNLAAKKTIVNIKGKVLGDTQKKINYLLTAPPLKKEFEKAMTDIRVAGTGELDLDLRLSIGKEVDAKVNGQLMLKDNKLELVQASGLLSHITGKLSFNETAISAKKVKADLLGQPVFIDVSTKDSRYNKNVRVNEYKAVGRFNAKSLSKLKFPFLHDMVDGDARWTVKLMAPHSKDGGKIDEDLRLTVYSDLKGVEVNLPSPFKKAKSDVRKLSVDTTFRNAKNTLIKASYAGRFEGISENDFTKEKWLSRGELRFGGGPAVLPGTSGLHIAGHMQTVSYDIWQNLIQQLMGQLDKQASAGNMRQAVSSKEQEGLMDFSIISSLDLTANNFEIFGQSASNANIKLVNKGTWLAATIDSSKFKGDVTIPNNFQTKPLVLDMQRMNIVPVEESGASLNPNDLPAIKLNSRSVTYGDKKLGRVAIETAKADNGLLLQQLIIRPRSTTIRGHGSWLLKNNVESSILELDIESDNVGNTMKDLGYVETIAEGKGTITAKLSWPAALVDPDLNHINGEVKMELTNGRILDIEPGGASRLFGLFSLQTLPRRLTLDFSDLFSKGLGFDTVNGDFNIEEGNAYTSNLQLKGPNADVALKGRIGLGAQDYDQRIVVTPHITDVTILLSIITSQPLLLLFQQLLKQDLDAATSFEYTLVGPWDNYQLIPVLKRLPPQPADSDEF